MRRLTVCCIQPEGGAVGARPRHPSDEVAVLERVDNIRLTPMPGRSAAAVLRAAVEPLRFWDNGRRLRVGSSTAPTPSQCPAAVRP
jgi:hypothetical protein